MLNRFEGMLTALLLIGSIVFAVFGGAELLAGNIPMAFVGIVGAVVSALMVNWLSRDYKA
jgi:hypothetical protein